MKNTVDMLSGSVFKGLLSITIPIMIMNVMQTLFSAIDMAILGNFADDTAVGAVGACSTLIVLCTSLLIGIASGANVVIARHIGRNDREDAEKAVGCAVLFAIVGGVALAVIGITCAELFLKWTNCPDSLFAQATVYFKIYFWGVPVIMFYNFCAAILRAIGDTRRPMRYLMLGGVTKILLNFFSVTVLHTTVEGVAVATIVSNAVAGGLCFAVMLKSKDMIHFNYKKMRFYGDELKQMLFIGVPTGLQSALYSLANTVIVTAVNSFGADATTGLSIANQFDGILYQIAHAPSLAIIPYVAQNVGAKNFKRAKDAVGKSVIITILFAASLGALSALFSRQLSSFMSTTPAVIAYSQQKMIIVSSTYFICGINEVMSGALRGIGKPIVPTVTTFVFMCLLRLFWVRYIFPLCPNLTFLYLVWPIGWILCLMIAMCVFFPGLAKLQKEASAPRIIDGRTPSVR
ncbi:MAG: MATE family efflux transporter [Oscillospiraceae bacterium]|nr:MATE family efflux transporter [Oscillospiraceae bacterium]